MSYIFILLATEKDLKQKCFLFEDSSAPLKESENREICDFRKSPYFLRGLKLLLHLTNVALSLPLIRQPN